MAKSQVAVAVDSTAYLPPDLAAEYKIHVIPQCLNWEGKTLLDGVDITPGQFYERLKVAKEMPTTSQPSAGEFHEFFGKIMDETESIVGIFISEHLSGTLNSARMALEMMPESSIEIVDSRSASMGLGFIALAAARAAAAGASQPEVVKMARDMVPLAKAIFVVDTLEFLHRGGRIGGAQRLLGSMLSIKPVLHLDDGRIEPLASVRTKKKALLRTLEIVAEDSANKGPLHASIIHAAAPDEAAQFQEAVQNELHPVEIFISELSPVVGANTGPGLVGMAYYCEPA